MGVAGLSVLSIGLSWVRIVWWSLFTVRAAVLRRKERDCGSCIVAPESALSSGGSSMGICVGCSFMVVGGRGEMLHVLSSQGAGAAWLIPGPSML